MIKSKILRSEILKAIKFLIVCAFVSLLVTGCGSSQYNPYSDNSADYDSSGNYRPVDQMSQDEIQAELESIINDSIGQ